MKVINKINTPRYTYEQKHWPGIGQCLGNNAGLVPSRLQWDDFLQAKCFPPGFDCAAQEELMPFPSGRLGWRGVTDRVSSYDAKCFLLRVGYLSYLNFY